MLESARLKKANQIFPFLKRQMKSKRANNNRHHHHHKSLNAHRPTSVVKNKESSLIDEISHRSLQLGTKTTSRSTTTSYEAKFSKCKIDDELRANLNALGFDEKSTVKGDLYSTLYNQNISLFSVKDKSLANLMGKHKQHSSLSSNFKGVRKGSI